MLLIMQLEHTMVSVTIPPEACGSSLMRQMHNDGIYRLRQPVRDHLEYLALLLAAQPPQAFCLLSFFNTCLAKCLPVAALLKECCLQLQGRPQQDRALCETEGKMEFPAAQCGSEAAVREIDGSDLVFGNLIAEAPEDVVRHLNLQLSVLRDLAEKLHHCRKAMQEKLSTVVGSQEQIAGILDSVAMISDQVLFSSASTVNRLLDSGNISAGASHAHTMPSKVRKDMAID